MKWMVLNLITVMIYCQLLFIFIKAIFSNIPFLYFYQELLYSVWVCNRMMISQQMSDCINCCDSYLCSETKHATGKKIRNWKSDKEKKFLEFALNLIKERLAGVQ